MRRLRCALLGWLVGHADGVPFMEKGRWRVRCADCGRVSPGMELAA